MDPLIAPRAGLEALDTYCQDWTDIAAIVTFSPFPWKTSGGGRVSGGLDRKLKLGRYSRTGMPDRDISMHELRSHTADVLRRVESGQRLRITLDRRPVAELIPLPRPDAWLPRERALAAIVQADPHLTDELDA